MQHLPVEGRAADGVHGPGVRGEGEFRRCPEGNGAAGTREGRSLGRGRAPQAIPAFHTHNEHSGIEV